MNVNIAVIYYSSAGNVFRLARAVADGATDSGEPTAEALAASRYQAWRVAEVAASLAHGRVAALAR